jgi:hypothetical protein
VHGSNLDNSRIIHQNIDPTKTLRGRVYQAVYLVSVGNIAGHSEYCGATLCQVVPRAFEFVEITGAQHKVTTRLRKLSGQRQAQTPRAAGNQHHLPADVFLTPPLQRFIPEPSKTGCR